MNEMVKNSSYQVYQKSMTHLSAQDIYDIDERMSREYHIQPSQLMEIAGCRIADWVRYHIYPGSTVYVVCGSGNNAGDGLVCARLLHCAQVSVHILWVKPPDQCHSLTQIQAKSCQSLGISESMVDEVNWSAISKNDVIVDALLGVGIESAPKDLFAAAIHKINQSQAFVISVDLPSGMQVHPSNIGVASQRVQPNTIISLVGPKQGFQQLENESIIIADIGTII